MTGIFPVVGFLAVGAGGVDHDAGFAFPSIGVKAQRIGGTINVAGFVISLLG